MFFIPSIEFNLNKKAKHRMIPKPQSWGLINFIPFLNTDKTDKTLTNLYTTLRNNH